VRIHERGTSRWYRLIIVALILLVVGGLLAFGYHRFVAWRDRPSEARRIAETTTVAGFVRTAIVDESDGDNPPYANAYFIGPAPKPDPVAVVSVPTIQLREAGSPPIAPEWDKARYAGGEPAPLRRSSQHRRRSATSRPRLQPARHTTAHLLKHDNAEALAKGRRPDGCEASVTFVSDPEPSTLDIRGEHSIAILKAEQLDEVRKGTSVFIKLTLDNCGW